MFERVLVPSAAGSDKWYGACARYFELLFAFDDVEVQIRDAGEHGVHTISREPAARGALLRFDRAIMEHPGGLKFRVRLDEVIRLASTVLPHLPAGSMEERMLSEVEQKTRDGPALAAWLSVVALQVAEHLAFEELVRFLTEARRALRPGGRLVVETVNPHALEAMKMFWVDPTHRVPLFPEVVTVLCGLTGFASAYVLYPNGGGDPDEDRRTQGEYAVVAEKAAPAP